MGSAERHAAPPRYEVEIPVASVPLKTQLLGAVLLGFFILQQETAAGVAVIVAPACFWLLGLWLIRLTSRSTRIRFLDDGIELKHGEGTHLLGWDALELQRAPGGFAIAFAGGRQQVPAASEQEQRRVVAALPPDQRIMDAPESKPRTSSILLIWILLVVLFAAYRSLR